MAKKGTDIILPEQADGAVVPIDVEQLVALVDAFDKFKSMVLKPSDFWLDTRENKRRVKKSGWLKYALACNLNLEKVDEREVDKEVPPGSGNWVTIYHFDYRAISMMGRYAEGSGSASTSERASSDKMIHDTRSLAQTRAMNRAISNLVGGGEVSAEEVMTSRKRVDSKQRTVKKKPKKKTTTKTLEETPQADPEEERVQTTLKGNGVDTKHLLIMKYSDNVRIVPQEDYDQVGWIDDHRVITELLKGVWNQEQNRWEVPPP